MITCFHVWCFLFPFKPNDTKSTNITYFPIGGKPHLRTFIVPLSGTRTLSVNLALTPLHRNQNRLTGSWINKGVVTCQYLFARVGRAWQESLEVTRVWKHNTYETAATRRRYCSPRKTEYRHSRPREKINYNMKNILFIFVLQSLLRLIQHNIVWCTQASH